MNPQENRFRSAARERRAASEAAPGDGGEVAADVELAGPCRPPEGSGREERRGDEEQQLGEERRARSGHGEFDSPFSIWCFLSLPGGGRGLAAWWVRVESFDGSDGDPGRLCRWAAPADATRSPSHLDGSSRTRVALDGRDCAEHVVLGFKMCPCDARLPRPRERNVLSRG